MDLCANLAPADRAAGPDARPRRPRAGPRPASRSRSRPATRSSSARAPASRCARPDAAQHAPAPSTATTAARSASSSINHGAEPVTIAHGMRIAQMVLAPVARIAWAEAGELARQRPRRRRLRLHRHRRPAPRADADMTLIARSSPASRSSLARLLRAPRGTWRSILAAAALAALASQLLPAGHPLRADLAGSADAARLAPRPSRSRSPPTRSGCARCAAAPAPPRPAAGAPGRPRADRRGRRPRRRDHRRARRRPPPRRSARRAPLSLAWRAEDGSARRPPPAAPGRRHRRDRGAPARRRQRIARQGIGTRLLAAAEAEARARGLARLAVAPRQLAGAGLLRPRRLSSPPPSATSAAAPAASGWSGALS